MSTATVALTYEPRGAARALFADRSPEVVLSGPADTGKTFACLQKLHLCAAKYGGMRAFITRKTHASLVGTALVTYQQRVLHPLDGVRFFGGSASAPPSFRYPNGSVVVVGGLDRPEKVLSAEYDMAYVNQAEELALTDWETLTTRLRGTVMPYQQLLADCNPGAPSHWLKQRTNTGLVHLLESRHEDNPALTPDRLAKLDRLTGVRRLRLRLGLWAAAEGVVYEAWDPAVHVVDAPPAGLRAAVAGVDWGFTKPGVIQVWQRDSDGRLYLVHEVYQTQRLIGWWVDQAKRLRDAFGIRAFVCDPSASAYIAQFQAAGLPAVPADNAIAPGVQAVQERLQPAADGRPRLFIVRGALAERDPDRDEARQPCGFLEEIEAFVWDKGKKGEQPADGEDHSMDAARYVCRQLERAAPVTVLAGGSRNLNPVAVRAGRLAGVR